MPRNEAQELYTIVHRAKEIWGDEVIKNLELKRMGEHVFTYEILLSTGIKLNVLWYKNKDWTKSTSLVITNNLSSRYQHDTDDPYSAATLFKEQAPILGISIETITANHESNSQLSISCDSRYHGKIEAKLLTSEISFIREAMLDPDADEFKVTFKIRFNKDTQQMTNEEIEPMLNLLEEGLERYGFRHDTSADIQYPYTPTGKRYSEVYHTTDPDNPNIMITTCIATRDT